MPPLRSTGAEAPNCANGASRCNRSVTSRRHSRTLPLDSPRANPQDWIVHAIAKRRHAPVSGTAPPPALEPGGAGGALSADVTTVPGNPGPKSNGAFSVGSAVTARPLSVSTARRTGPGEVVGAIIQTAPRSSGRSGGKGGRSATAYTGAPSAAPTWAGSHSGIVSTAASPVGNGGGEPGSPSTSPNATRSSAARRPTSSALSGPSPEDARTTPGITK